MGIIQSIILLTIELLSCKIFIDSFANVRKCLAGWRVYIGYILVLPIMLFTSYFLQYNIIAKTVMVALLFVLLVNIVYSGKKTYLSILALVYYGLVLCVDRALIIIIGLLVEPERLEFISQDMIKLTIVALVCKLFVFICVLVIQKRFSDKALISCLNIKEWLCFLIMAVASLGGMTAFAVSERRGDVTVLIVSLIIVAMNFLFFYMITEIITKEREIRKMKLNQERNKRRMEQYENIEQHYRLQREKVHEFRNYILCIKGMLKAGSYDEMRKFVNNTDKKLEFEMDHIKTNNIIVNIILNEKFNQARKKGIPLVVVAETEGEMGIEEEDVASLLANLLDNAIEACEKIIAQKPIIKISIQYIQGVLQIVIRNPYDGVMKISDKGVMTTKDNKEEHGYGMININNIIKKYNGEGTYTYDDNMFTYEIEI